MSTRIVHSKEEMEAHRKRIREFVNLPEEEYARSMAFKIASEDPSPTERIRFGTSVYASLKEMCERGGSEAATLGLMEAGVEIDPRQALLHGNEGAAKGWLASTKKKEFWDIDGEDSPISAALCGFYEEMALEMLYFTDKQPTEKELMCAVYRGPFAREFAEEVKRKGWMTSRVAQAGLDALLDYRGDGAKQDGLISSTADFWRSMGANMAKGKAPYRLGKSKPQRKKNDARRLTEMFDEDAGPRDHPIREDALLAALRQKDRLITERLAATCRVSEEAWDCVWSLDRKTLDVAKDLAKRLAKSGASPNLARLPKNPVLKEFAEYLAAQAEAHQLKTAMAKTRSSSQRRRI